MAEIDLWLSACVVRYPYYARAVASLKPVHRDGFDTIAVTDQWALIYSEESLARIQKDGGHPAECIAHEILHLIRDHGGRVGQREPKSWNAACDMEINDDLDQFELPTWALFPEKSGKVAEQYYSSPSPSCGKSCGGGSGAGNPLPDEPKGDVSREVAEQIREETADAIVQAAKRGTLPKGDLLWAQARLKARIRVVDWRFAMRSSLSTWLQGQEDLSYVRLSRRAEPGDQILPPGRIRSKKSATVVLDTSMSMLRHSDRVAEAFEEIARGAPGSRLLEVDAKVHRQTRLNSWREIFRSKGGGGTDLRVGIEAARRYKEPVIVITDGETPWPKNTKRLAAILVKESGCEWHSFVR